MSKISLIERNKKRAKLINKYANKRKKIKDSLKDPSSNLEEMFKLRLELAALPRNSAKSRYRLRCQLTGRPRGNYSQFGICRNKFRELASKGQIPGVIKSSW